MLHIKEYLSANKEATLVSLLVNIFSSVVMSECAGCRDKILLWKHRRRIAGWANAYIKNHDGTILCRGEYVNYLQRNHVFEEFYRYIAEPDKSGLDETAFVEEQAERCQVWMEKRNRLSPSDHRDLKEFYGKLLSELKEIWRLCGEGRLKQLLYHVVQIECGQTTEIEILKKSYALTDRVAARLEEYIQSVRAELCNSGPILEEQWFVEQNKQSIANLGSRYLPDLNVDLEIQKYFDILAGSGSFFEEVRALFQRLMSVTANESGWDFSIQKKISEQQYHVLREQVREALEMLTDVDRYREMQDSLNAFLIFCMDQGNYEYRERTGRRHRGEDILPTEIERFYRIVQVCNEIAGLFDQAVKSMLQYPYMVLYGKGGIGKSHLMADTVVKHGQRKEYSVLLLGEDFPKDALIHIRIPQILDLPYSVNQIFTRMNQLAKEKHIRILFMIDALNEGGGRELWRSHLPGLLQTVAKYQWIGLAVSVRTDFMPDMISDDVIRKFHITRIEHVGLGRMADEAIRKYFEAYGIDIRVMPYIPEEFHNPLFLRMFCEGYDETENGTEMKVTTIQIYGNYIRSINKKLSAVYEYSRELPVLDEILEAFVRRSYREGERNKLRKKDAVGLVAEIAGKYQIRTTIYDSLISEGILTDEIDPDREEYVRVTYERLADHIYAKIWVDAIIHQETEHAGLIGKIDQPGVVYELTILLAEQGIELYECFPELRDRDEIIDAFLEGIVWRNDKALYSEGTKRFAEDILKAADQDARKAGRVLDSLVRVAVRPGHPFNAAFLHDYLAELTMPERDGRYMSLFWQWCQEDGAVRRMIDWMERNLFLPKPEIELQEEDRYLMAVILLWMTVTTDTRLYNELGAVLCTLLRGHSRVMIRLIGTFHKVDDPYVLAMLYAVGLGVILYEKSEEMIRLLGKTVYSVFYIQDKVVVDIMVRDYARSIVLYAVRCGGLQNISMERVNGPFSDSFPDIPGDEELEGYKNRFRDSKGVSSILYSMQVDWKGGWYGDFGRYVFQRYFEGWKGVNAYDLMKIAVRDILENRYRPQLHEGYDREIFNPYRISDWKIERIGKKYQWQALYRLAAQVSDNFFHINEATEEEEYYNGNYEHNLRKFDPTVNYYPHTVKRGDLPPVNDPCFGLEYGEWLHTRKNLPRMADLLSLSLEQAEYWMLDGYVRVEEEVWQEAGGEMDAYPHKEMWFMVHAYMVKEEEYDKCRKLLEHEDFWGRWMPEATEDYSMYNREYYWSDPYEYHENEYFGGSPWKHARNWSLPEVEDIELLVLTRTYVGTGEKELHNLPCNRWSKPCKPLYEELELQYKEDNTILYDRDGQMACFDTVELFRKEQGFYMDKSLLEQFMERNHYRIFWTVLGEKRWMDYSYGEGDDRFPSQEYSGFATAEEDGLSGEIRENARFA